MLLKRPFWILMAVMCIVFSGATKKLIEQKMAPYITISQALGKKIKDGSKDKRDCFKLVVHSEQQNADTAIPGILFFLSALIAIAGILFGTLLVHKVAIRKSPFTIAILPLYLRTHRLQV